MAELEAKLGNPTALDTLTNPEKEVWATYQNFLACIDTTIVNPPNAAQVAAILTLATATAGGAMPKG